MSDPASCARSRRRATTLSGHHRLDQLHRDRARAQRPSDQGPARRPGDDDEPVRHDADLAAERKDRAGGRHRHPVPAAAAAVLHHHDDRHDPVYNQIQLDKIDPAFVGAYLQFVAKPLNATTGTGLEISDLRFFNRKPGAAANEQRSIHFKNPLFVLWRAGVPYPDPAQSFYGFERTIKLNQDDVGQVGKGVLIIPGIPRPRSVPYRLLAERGLRPD